MICFPNGKINIGLNVLEKRADGYHNIESIFYPVDWCDVLEAIKTEDKRDLKLNILGNPVPGSVESNLCYKAYHLLNTKYKLPSLNLWLLKCIPMGAGLGGGSADAAFLLKLLNDFFELHLSMEELKLYASQIGSDCTFFIENKPAFVSGRGDVNTAVKLDLSNYYISIVYPEIHVDTSNAYSLVKPQRKSYSLQEVIFSPIHTWKETIVNDFEEPVFRAYPQLAEIKNCLYTEGALYASMTGSGSALYAIFDKKVRLDNVFPSCKIWTVSPCKLI